MTTRMITSCPACSTLFKVGPEQLQIASGWVRCGQCMVVFDAQERMLSAEEHVPPDSDWQEQAEEPDETLPSGPAEDPANDPPVAAADDEVIAPAPESRDDSPAAAAPEKPQTEPASSGESPPASTAAPTDTATHDQATTPAPPLPIPTRDELDRRHAKLLETLARLRESAERHKSKLEETDTAATPDDDGSGQPAHKDWQINPRRLWRSAFGHGADRHDAPADRESAHQHKRGSQSRLRRKDRRATPDSQPWPHQESDEDLSSRPMIDFVLSEIGPSLSLPAAPVPPQPEQAPSPLESESETKPPPQPGVPSFVEQARRRRFWTLPLVRAGLWLTATALVLMLAAQIASQRDRLAARHPGMVPLLRTLCHPPQCQIGPWRHRGAVAIDSPALVRLEADSFRIEITLRNNSAAPVVTPALELALIDAQDQPLVRRALNPADWGAPPQLAAHGEFTGVALLTVLDTVNAQDISNYHLDIFYP